MDEEGFPVPEVGASYMSDWDLPQLNRRLSLYGDRPRRRDHESGETTGRQVVVIRRSPRLSPFHVHLQDNAHYINLGHQHQTVSHQARLNTTDHPAPQLHMSSMRLGSIIGPVLPTRHSSPSLDNLALSPRSPRDAASRQLKSKRRFRIPVKFTETSKSQKEGVVSVSIWKELLLGSSVFDYSDEDRKEILKRYLYPCWLRKHINQVSLYIPLALIRFLQLLTLALHLIVPRISIAMCYYCLYTTHLKIHQVGRERGIQVVFTGNAYQGPLIYGIRAHCTYCRLEGQSKASLEYLQTLQEERRTSTFR